MSISKQIEQKTRLLGLMLGPALVLLVLFLIFLFLPKPPNAARKEKMPAQALHIAQLAQLKMDKNACVWSTQPPDRYTCKFTEMDENLMLRKIAAEGWEYRGNDSSFGKLRRWEKYFFKYGVLLTLGCQSEDAQSACFLQLAESV